MTGHVTGHDAVRPSSRSVTLSDGVRVDSDPIQTIRVIPALQCARGDASARSAGTRIPAGPYTAREACLHGLPQVKIRSPATGMLTGKRFPANTTEVSRSGPHPSPMLEFKVSPSLGGRSLRTVCCGARCVAVPSRLIRVLGYVIRVRPIRDGPCSRGGGDWEADCHLLPTEKMLY